MAGRGIVVVGLGVTGRAVARACIDRGVEVVAIDDRRDDDLVTAAAEIGVTLAEANTPDALESLLAGRGAVAPSPGIPDSHSVFAAARAADVPVVSEFDLAQRWDPRPVIAITGTDGKTTVTMMVAAMLEASGRPSAAVGNTEVPLIAAIDDPAIEVFVAESSSFRLGHSCAFAPSVATWLNFGPDHLDVHASLERYEAAKARIWANRPPTAVAIANADDPVVMSHAPDDAVTFGVAQGDWCTKDEMLTADGRPIIELADLWRTMPHDLANAAAASATAFHAGATLTGIRTALAEFRGLPHRVELVADRDGVAWYNDSKATAPHATTAAVAGFDSVVLIAGGRNKGLDLAELASISEHLRAVVAIGDSADEVGAVFAGRTPVHVAGSMSDAVDIAGDLALSGDVVLLSPGCASFDWYRSYSERGDDFARHVRDRMEARP